MAISIFPSLLVLYFFLIGDPKLNGVLGLNLGLYPKLPKYPFKSGVVHWVMNSPSDVVHGISTLVGK